MRILFIVPYVPTLIRTRPYNLLRTLARRGHSLTLATLWETPREHAALAALADENVEVLAAPLPRWRSAVNSLYALSSHLPLQARYCWQPALAAQLAQRLSTPGVKFDVIHVEHLRGAEYGRWVQRRPLGQRPPLIWDSVDCISLLFAQTARHSRSRLGRWMARLELHRTRRYEGEAVQSFDGVLATSDRDAAALEQLAAELAGTSAGPTHRVQTLPNGVDTDYFYPAREPVTASRVVFSGKMSYHANVSAALTLVSDIMPHVWTKNPEVEVVLAGSAPPREVRALASRFAPRVTVTGHVADLRPHLQAAALAAAPIPYGAGIQNKVLEAMACGVPVVASPQASSAIAARPGSELWVAESPEAFATQILHLLSDPALRQALGAAGRQYVETHHRWDRIVGHLEALYDSSIARAHQRAT